MIPVQQAMAFSDAVDIVNREMLERIAKTLAAEVRRLREENERLRKDAEKRDSIPVRYVSLQHIKTKVTDANPNPVQVNIVSERDGAWLDMPHEKIDIMRTEMQAAIDAARGGK